MTIRRARYDDMPRLTEIFASARQIMRDSGNLHQWDDSYPSEDTIRSDISEGVCHVLCDESDGSIIATMAFISGPDPTYARIYEDPAMTIECSWPDDSPYQVIHRIAACESGHGAFGHLLRWAASNSGGTIRIDTHEDNVIMHHLLRKNGFTRCGYIRLASGAPRVAYISKFF